MTKRNKEVMVCTRMTELELSQLDYIRKPGETRSGAIRRLTSDAYADEMMEFDRQHGASISDRVNCL